MIAEVASWAAPAATMIAAMMTAANIGSRVTGWGFAVFVAGSVAWSVVGIATGQTNLVLTNAFLTLVNLFGVWRWLGRQAKYDDGSARAAHRSARARVPTLFALGALPGTKIIGPHGEAIGTIVDAMAACHDAKLSYVVVSVGGLGGLGEQLHAIDPNLLAFSHDGVTTTLSRADLAGLPTIEPEDWPAMLPAATRTPGNPAGGSGEIMTMKSDTVSPGSRRAEPAPESS